jgi:excisionase family DNA binding protein
LVSADTIANWISAGRLPAQRTVGGQYRIRLSDLRSFMTAHGMSTELLDEELGRAPTCWRFWTSPGQSDPPATCVECPVYRAQASVCHEIRPLLPGGTQRALSCADCDFLAGRRAPDDERS